MRKYRYLKSKKRGLINKTLPLPGKDFKALVVDDRIARISVNLTGDRVFAFMPLYKLERDNLALWLKEIDIFVKQGNVSVYAEECLKLNTAGRTSRIFRLLLLLLQGNRYPSGFVGSRQRDKKV